MHGLDSRPQALVVSDDVARGDRQIISSIRIVILECFAVLPVDACRASHRCRRRSDVVLRDDFVAGVGARLEVCHVGHRVVRTAIRTLDVLEDRSRSKSDVVLCRHERTLARSLSGRSDSLDLELPIVPAESVVVGVRTGYVCPPAPRIAPELRAVLELVLPCRFVRFGVARDREHGTVRVRCADGQTRTRRYFDLVRVRGLVPVRCRIVDRDLAVFLLVVSQDAGLHLYLRDAF